MTPESATWSQPPRMNRTSVVTSAGLAVLQSCEQCGLEEIVESGRASGAPVNAVRAVFETNVFGVIAVTQTMLPLVHEAPAARRHHS